jgi:hypothetical protein
MPEFGGHPRQVVAVVAARVVEYFATPQLVHAIEPFTVLYFPAGHIVQVPPSGPVYPSLQMQAVNAVLTVAEVALISQALHIVAPVIAEYFPAGQLVHPLSGHFTSLYFPAAHDVHRPIVGPVNPSLQFAVQQLLLELLPVLEYILLVHAMQVVATVACSVVEYVPVMHSLHLDAPVTLL